MASSIVKRTSVLVTPAVDTHLASVGLYVTSYLSTLSMDVAQDTFTDVGVRNVTVMFSGIPGPPGIDPETITASMPAIRDFDNSPRMGFCYVCLIPGNWDWGLVFFFGSHLFLSGFIFCRFN